MTPRLQGIVSTPTIGADIRAWRDDLAALTRRGQRIAKAYADEHRGVGDVGLELVLISSELNVERLTVWLRGRA